MPFTRVVILGGGPIGLLCAIEAKRYFANVVIIEKRGAYTRTNVPSLNTPLIKHLEQIGVAKTVWPDSKAGESVAFSKLEAALWQRAQGLGVTMERGFTVVGITGKNQMQNGRYKKLQITIAPWDDKNKCLVAHGVTKDIPADLLVVASGGSAARDTIVRQTLGFDFIALKAKNYAAYGIFESGRSEEPVDFAQQSEFAGLTNKIVSGKIAFPTPDHNYLLVTLSQCTKTDFKYLQQSAEAFHTLLTAVSEGFQTSLLREIKEVQKNTGLFKVSIQRVRHFYSDAYPAVIVGDAAVTPHPEAGSGMLTGFAGVQQLSVLFAALAGTNRSADNSGAWMHFNQCYELFVSKKALEGTRIILRNLLKLLERFISDAGEIKKECNGSQILEPLQNMINTADTLQSVLNLHDFRAQRLLDILDGESEKFDWKKCGTDQLWWDIGFAYSAIKKLTSNIGLFKDRLEKVELALATRKVAGKELRV
jgi:2-polyprenyl-6-methoxyphenol hydroxylase-like FAD-dependent oxidoreductase